MKNIITVILSELKIKYTRQFLNNIYRDTPDRDNFYGLSYMLSVFGVESRAYYVNEKNLVDIQLPFVAHTNSGFAFVLDVKDDKVLYHDGNGRQIASISSFERAWTGNLLVLKKGIDSEEIDYKEHRRKECSEWLKILILSSSCFSLFLGLILAQFQAFTVTMLMYMALCMLGLFVSMLLLGYQWHIKSQLIAKICNSSSKNSCEEVTNSAASKTLLGISWAEIGLGYFLSSLLFLILMPNSFIILGIINIIILPYTVWSIWYQKTVIKKWCLLCLSEQGILWGLFIVFCFSRPSICLSPFHPLYLLFIPLFIATILLVHYYSNKKETIFRQEKAISSYHSFLCKKEILSDLLGMQKIIDVSDEDSHIVIGNPYAKTCLTIICNPFCQPCTHTHRMIERLIRPRCDIQVRYVFSTNNEFIYIASQYLVSSYFAFGEAPINEWFNMSLAERKKLMTLINLIEHDTEVERELNLHKAVIKNNGIMWTPTILINGRIVPSIYAIEDLAYYLFE